MAYVVRRVIWLDQLFSIHSLVVLEGYAAWVLQGTYSRIFVIQR